MRTRRQEKYLYTALSTGEFAERTYQSAAQVRELIEEGWFGTTPDGLPECLDVSAPKSKQPTYRIHVDAVKRYYAERKPQTRKSA